MNGKELVVIAKKLSKEMDLIDSRFSKEQNELEKERLIQLNKINALYANKYAREIKKLVK